MAGAVLPPGVYPLHRCKTIHLVRHGQGHHNVAGEVDGDSAFLSPKYTDASLTPIGWRQVESLRHHLASTPAAPTIDLVVSSPLMRTLQTACGVFGGERVKNGEERPLMESGAEGNPLGTLSSLGCPPFVATELCREHMGVHWCDKRRDISFYRPLFQGVDFSEVATDEDTWWELEHRETTAELAARSQKFVAWLLGRSEKNIAVVSHSGFLIQLLAAFGADCDPTVAKEVRRGYANCELRSVILADRGALQKEVASTDFPGGTAAVTKKEAPAAVAGSV